MDVQPLFAVSPPAPPPLHHHMFHEYNKNNHENQKETLAFKSVLLIIAPIVVIFLIVIALLLLLLLRRASSGKNNTVHEPSCSCNVSTRNSSLNKAQFSKFIFTTEASNTLGYNPEIGRCIYSGRLGFSPQVMMRCKRGQVFTYKELELATDGFIEANVIGRGGFGVVFRGILSDGTVAAIKVLHREGRHGEREFRSEVDLLSRLNSTYLVGLLGYCADQHHRMLVFEFMPNGTLQHHLHPNSGHRNPALNWSIRLRIALDCARGLEFLHEHSVPSVIHRDFKSSNILLDHNYRAKVSDFGMARTGSDRINGQVLTRVLGTTGYLAPEYASTGKLTTKSDVYSYGVVLLELLTGRRPIDLKRPPEEDILVSWALPRLTENLTLYAQPFKTSQLFFFGVVQYLKKSLLYMVRKGGWFMVLSILVVAFWVLLISIDGPHEKHVQEIINYSRFCLWWVALGVASSIGLGFGLHTFVLYLGPHIGLFTIKASQCGRVDLKSAPYDTIQLNRGPSWLGKDCLEFGPPLFPPVTGSRVRIPLSSILPQVLLEAILWGLGTALGELPPYFIARAARLSGSKVGSMEELDVTSSNGASSEDGIISTLLKKAKCWLFSHSRHLNFLTVLALASVPNPLFDLAGIMCGQFGVSFWTFFLATLLGKAIIKTHLQTVFIILVCNNQLLELLENELLWLLGLIPGFSSMLPKITVKLHTAKEKYLSAPVPTKVKGKQLNLSFNLVWNTIVWIMVLNFFIKIVTTIAQEYLKKQHKLELANKIAELKQLKAESDCASPSS